jgi:hypothetical protein
MGLVAVAVPAVASAQTPAIDPFEPNDSAQAATALEPSKRLTATIAGPADADWYTIVTGSPSWMETFAAGSKQRVSIGAERLGDSCAERSLRVTLYIDGRLDTSQPVYPGAEANVLRLGGVRGARYDLLVDTALDPGCAQSVRYTLVGTAFTPVSPIVGSEPRDAKPNALTCASYGKDARQLKKRIKSLSRIKRPSAKQRKLRKKLRKDLVSKRRILKDVCPK